MRGPRQHERFRARQPFEHHLVSCRPDGRDFGALLAYHGEHSLCDAFRLVARERPFLHCRKRVHRTGAIACLDFVLELDPSTLARLSSDLARASCVTAVTGITIDNRMRLEGRVRIVILLSFASTAAFSESVREAIPDGRDL